MSTAYISGGREKALAALDCVIKAAMEYHDTISITYKSTHGGKGLRCWVKAENVKQN